MNEMTLLFELPDGTTHQETVSFDITLSDEDAAWVLQEADTNDLMDVSAHVLYKQLAKPELTSPTQLKEFLVRANQGDPEVVSG